jgi:hypothetical protein
VVAEFRDGLELELELEKGSSVEPGLRVRCLLKGDRAGSDRDGDASREPVDPTIKWGAAGVVAM